ncbi:Ig domain-containing protein [Granulicella arctica]|uniref:Ig domain-containing protein n=1 Tax=Granulicella arctica TaxID=940613 RepID=UPI0021E031DB|nr:Ig domain-containing protein [Granulicella arctica]
MSYRAQLITTFLLTLACLLLAIVGCGSHPSNPSNPAPPTNLVYPQSTITAMVGQEIAADTPSVTGTVTSYTISPALPAGLNLNATTGAISGTPTAVAAQATYTVTAMSSSGNTTTTLQIVVNALAPTLLVYPQTAIVATVGQAITPDMPTVTGTVTSFTVSPALPAGLSLSTSTGTISGVPTMVAAQATYTITATNLSGSTMAAVQIVVNVAPPTNLAYPQTKITAAVGQAIAADIPSVTGIVTSYTISPALPAGLSLNATTGAISGTPAAAVPQATYTVTAANASGNTTATVQIVVNLSAPTNLIYPQTNIAATIGQAIATDTPSVTGTVTSYTVSPALPTGLSLSVSTGAISGTPAAAVLQATYTVTAANASGNTTATVQIVVNLGAPTGLAYPQTTIAANVGQAITTDTPTITGTVTSYTISPALPNGLSLSATTGAISGTPGAVSAQTNYTITASNAVGSTTANLGIAVASFSVFSLVDLGHANQISLLRLQPTRLFSQDISGHWALWDYIATNELASGDAIAPNPKLPYPADMAGAALAIGAANTVEIRSNANGKLITTVSLPALARISWWKLATDGSYVAAGYSSGLFVWSTADGHQLFTRSGDYSRANAFAAPQQLQVALGPAGNNVIETDSIPNGTSSIGPVFLANFNTWFTDGSHFITNTLDLNPPFSPPLYSVYTYSSLSSQEGMISLNSLEGLNGYGNWLWRFPSSSSLIFYTVGATTPVISYPFGSITTLVPSGSTIGLLAYGTGAASIVDLSGSTPVLTQATLPVAYVTTFAATSPTQWVAGNHNGVVLDGPSVTTNTRFFGYGNALSIAGAPGLVSIATASGKILSYNPDSPTITNTINFTSSKLALSIDGTVLAAKASDVESQYEPDRTLNIYSLPDGTLTKSFPYQFVDTPPTPFLFDFTLSGSGTALGQLLGTYNGLYFDYTRQVTPLAGTPIIWSDHPASGVYEGSEAMFLSPDGTLVAASTGDYSATSQTSIYKNGALVATVNGFIVGWIDNNRLLVNNFTGNNGNGTLASTGAAIFDATGNQLANLPTLPQLAPPQNSGYLGGFQTVSPNEIYSPVTYSIYSLSTGALVWTEPLLLGKTTVLLNQGVSTIAGNYLVFNSGSRILVDIP